MPRIHANCGDPDDFNYESLPIDLCNDCYNNITMSLTSDDFEAINTELEYYKLLLPDATSYDFDGEHPYYSQCNYDCESCHEPLTDEDN